MGIKTWVLPSVTVCLLFPCYTYTSLSSGVTEVLGNGEIKSSNRRRAKKNRDDVDASTPGRGGGRCVMFNLLQVGGERLYHQYSLRGH